VPREGHLPHDGDREGQGHPRRGAARPNDRNAPSEINDLEGYEVVSVPCRVRDHPDGQTYARHHLVRDPEAKPRQLALIA